MAAKKIVLITGANTGLGYEIVKALAKSSTPYEIIVGCRRPSSGDEAIQKVQSEVKTSSTFSTLAVDLASDTVLEKAVEDIGSKYGKLDCLINNGGASFDGDVASGKLSLRDGFNKSWDTNVAGTHVLTTLAVPLLLKSSDPRLIFMTSGTSSMLETVTREGIAARVNQPPPAGWPKDPGVNPVTLYKSSKAGLNMLMREWYRILENDGVKLWAVSPGFLATGLAGVGAEKLKQFGALDPSVGGEFVRDVVEGKRDHHVGKIIRNHDVIQDW